MKNSDGSFCLPVYVYVYLSRAVTLIFHFKGGATYRGQCFPQFYTYFFVWSCTVVLRVCLLLFAYRSLACYSLAPFSRDLLPFWFKFKDVADTIYLFSIEFKSGTLKQMYIYHNSILKCPLISPQNTVLMFSVCAHFQPLYEVSLSGLGGLIILLAVWNQFPC